VAESENEIPEAVAVKKSRRTVQLVWLIPIIAALVGGWLAVKSILDKGPVITITFKTAEGLEAGKTKLKFKDVDIGLVSKVEIAKDLSTVIVTAELVKDFAAQLVEDTRFWVVRPRISGGSVSGLGTLLSGSYIGVGVGKSTKKQHTFAGLEVPPVLASAEPGREFVLRSSDLGSLDYGSPVFFRRLQVGEIVGYDLDKDGKGVTLRLFVRAPFDQYVNQNTRFWHASGVDLTLDASGVKVDTQSLVSIVLGGLAFQTPATSEALPPAEPNAAFELYPNHRSGHEKPRFAGYENDHDVQRVGARPSGRRADRLPWHRNRCGHRDQGSIERRHQARRDRGRSGHLSGAIARPRRRRTLGIEREGTRCYDRWHGRARPARTTTHRQPAHRAAVHCARICPRCAESQNKLGRETA
jgi:paraquat-inducible protein B